MLDGDEVRVDGATLEARSPTSRARRCACSPSATRCIASSCGAGPTRGRYTLWVDGFRHEVEALDERMRAIRELAGASGGPGGTGAARSPRCRG